MYNISIFKLVIAIEHDKMYSNEKILNQINIYLHVDITYSGGDGN